MEDFALSLALLGAGLAVVPLLDPKDGRARAVLFGICTVLTWRYIFWRFGETLPPLALRFDSVYAWGFSLVEALCNVSWTLGFVNLSRRRAKRASGTSTGTLVMASVYRSTKRSSSEKL